MKSLNMYLTTGISLTLSLFFIIVLSNTKLQAQTENERIDELIEEGNFDEAIHVGTGLLADDPENANLNFKVGYAYLNTALRKPKSIQYLEKTVAVIDKKKYTTSFIFEAKFYLGKAYHSNYDFKKAIKLYTALLETTKNNNL